MLNITNTTAKLCTEIGIELYSCDGSKVVNCLVYKNRDYGIAGFIGRYEIINCTIVKNYGYGLWFATLSRYPPVEPIIKNCIAVNNNIGTYVSANSYPEITYSDVWGNNTNYKGCTGGEECISENPLFVSPTLDDYHLLPDSLCIDAGTDVDAPLYDIEGNIRPYGVRVDMGAYEFTVEGIKLIYPLNESVINDITPTFKWEIPGEENNKNLHFKIEIADDPEFVNILYSYESKIEPSGFSPLPPVVPGKAHQFYTMLRNLEYQPYFWRVSAWNGEDHYIASPVWGFTIQKQ